MATVRLPWSDEELISLVSFTNSVVAEWLGLKPDWKGEIGNILISQRFLLLNRLLLQVYNYWGLRSFHHYEEGSLGHISKQEVFHQSLKTC